jgi:hypothetical protein
MSFTVTLSVIVTLRFTVTLSLSKGSKPIVILSLSKDAHARIHYKIKAVPFKRNSFITRKS